MIVETRVRRAAAPPSTEEIEVVITDRVEDVDEALSLVHDGFAESGYISQQPSGRRMHLSYLNPGSAFVLARMGGQAVGAAALIVDGPFGVPADRAFAEENDILRATSAAPLVECGSFVIGTQWRRHTRRIIMRVIAALARAGLTSAADGPVVITAAPQNERFYGMIVGMHPIAGPRPLYGSPAVLLQARSIADVARHCAEGDSPCLRAMDRLIHEPHPSWLVDRRTGRALPGGWLGELIEEQDLLDPIRAQLRLLAVRHPQALSAVLRHAGDVQAA
jgi:hypothetical protein